MKQPISVAITDTHAHEGNTDDVLRIFKDAFQLASKLGLDRVDHLGDFFTDRKAQKLTVLYLFQEISFMAVELGITLYIIPGNHDKTDQADIKSYLGIFSYYPNVEVLDGSKIAKNRLTTPKVVIHYLGYFTDDVYAEMISNLKLSTKRKNVLYTHKGIDGVLNNDGDSVESKVVKVGIYKPFDLTFIGHYHNAQKVTSKIHYIGSPEPRNYGEDDNKGIIVLYDDLTFERIQRDFRRFINVPITTPDKVKIEKLVKKYKNSEDKIRFTFELTDEEYLTVDQAQIESLGIDVKRKTVSTSTADDEVSEVSATFSKKDITGNFLKYCVENEIKGENRTYGLSLIKRLK